MRYVFVAMLLLLALGAAQAAPWVILDAGLQDTAQFKTIWATGAALNGRSDLSGNPGERFNLTFTGSAGSWSKIGIGDNYPIVAATGNGNGTSWGNLTGYSAYTMTVRNPNTSGWFCASVYITNHSSGVWHESPPQWVAPGQTAVLTLTLDPAWGLNEVANIGMQICSNIGNTNNYDMPAGVPFDFDVLGNYLTLNATSESLYVKPGEYAVINVDVSGLNQKVNACQAMLAYNSTYLTASAGCVVPGTPPWNELIYNSWDLPDATPGEIDTAIGVDAGTGPTPGTEADGTVAVISLLAGSQDHTTQVVFRPDVSDVESTFLSDMSSNQVWPNKWDSQTIVIDGTDPTGVTITASPSTWTKNSPVVLTFSATDALSGIDHYELSLNGGGYFTATSPYNWNVSALGTGTYPATVKAIDKAGNFATASTTVYIDKTNPLINIDSYPSPDPVLQGTYDIVVTASDANAGLAGAPIVTVSGMTVSGPTGSAPTWTYQVTVDSATANGSHTINASVTDNAGNSASDNKSFVVNKNQITGTVSMSFVGTGTRVVTFVMNGTITMTADVASDGAYILTDVPDGVTSVSAKTAWTLRQKLSGLSATDGQITADFTLLAGDINGTNSINILDYSILKANWLGANPAADINGSGVVNVDDYNLMKLNWFKAGDIQ